MAGLRGLPGRAGRDGRTGTTGAVGANGAVGATGATGPQGEATDLERVFAEHVAYALGERKLRLTDRRLLILYLSLIAGLVTVLWLFSRQEQQTEQRNREFQTAITTVCVDLNDSHERVNGLLEQLAESAASRPDRTPEEQARAREVYEGLKLAELDCPPLEVG